MNENTAVHTLARRYCQEQSWRWIQRYKELQRDPGTEGDYSPKADDTFPRYHILEAILRAVEELTPDGIGSGDLTVEAMVHVAQGADVRLRVSLPSPIAASAVADEKGKFITYIRTLTAEQIAAAEPLPYRHALTKEESNQLWAQLKEKWAVDDDYWYPLRNNELPEGMLAFHTDYFGEDKEAILRELLAPRGIQRIWELREFDDPEYELELSLLEPHYSGSEGYWTSTAMDWLVYASHESSITIAGDWLVEAFKAKLPECIRYLYVGPHRTPDLRGTWDWKRESPHRAD